MMKSKAMPGSSHPGMEKASGSVDVDVLLLPLPEDGLLKVKDVIKYIRVSQATWFEWVKSGLAPKSIKIGCNTFWRGRDLRIFINEVCDAANT